MLNLRTWFADYIRSFKSRDENLKSNAELKENHSRRVCEEILNIGRHLGLGINEMRMAEIIALLHDVGRFEQYARYQTFVDARSVNHAELGVKILKENKVLKELDEQTRELALRAILVHNLAHLPEMEEENCLFFSRLLRDADKLDIWRVVIDYYYRSNPERNAVIEYGLPDTPGISKEVYQDLMEERIVSIEHLHNLSDFKLLQVGWIYDINFQPTYEAILHRKYLDKLRKSLPDSPEINKIFSHVNSYLEHKTGLTGP